MEDVRLISIGDSSLDDRLMGIAEALERVATAVEQLTATVARLQG